MTPDYHMPQKKLRRNNSSVNFGEVKEIIVERLVYHSPRFFENIRRNEVRQREIIRNWNLSPRCYVVNRVSLEKIPGSA